MGNLGPARIIFSRKGFDSSRGGCPSPIIDGKPISLPIPPQGTPSPIEYGDLRGSYDYGTLVEELTSGKISRRDPCHLDPDLDQSLLPRQAGWRGALGQVRAAQSHLQNNGVTHGDLFLFWGLFRHVEHAGRWKFIGLPEHRLFGWLQVDEILNLGTDGWQSALKIRSWLRDHPHVRAGWVRQNNTLYVAAESLRLGRHQLKLPGWGVFQTGRRLTAPNSLPSTWTVPNWLNPERGGVGMTYHPAGRWNRDGTVQCVGRGQEFVSSIGDRDDALIWLRDLFEELG